jgi:O-antigen/teichoic acid export membrane protein
VALAEPVASLLLGDTSYTDVMRLAFLGTLFMSIGIFGNVIFQTWLQFNRMAIYAIVTNGARLAAIAVLAAAGVLGVKSGVVAYAMAPLLGLVMIVFSVNRMLFKPVSQPDNSGVMRDIFHFNKWLAVAFTCDAVTTRVGILILAYVRGGGDVAIFAAAMQISLVLPLLLFSLISVLLPRVSMMKTREEFMNYLKQAVSTSALLGTLFIPLIIFAGPVVNLIYGSVYAESATILRILLLSFIINLVVNPLYTILYPMNKTFLVAMLAVPNLVGTALVTYFMAVSHGALGAAYANLLVTAVWSALVGVMIWWHMARMPATQELPPKEEFYPALLENES